MVKPIAKKRAFAKAAKRADAEDASTRKRDPLPAPADNSKRARHLARKESRVAKLAAKKTKRAAASGIKTVAADDDGGDGASAISTTGKATSAAAASVWTKAAIAFAPAQYAKHAAAKLRESKKTAAIRQASKKRNASMTTTNLSDRTRQHLFASELQQVGAIAAHEAFVADPFAALRQHLEATTEHLQPQTADIGKKAVAVKHRAGRNQ